MPIGPRASRAGPSESRRTEGAGDEEAVGDPVMGTTRRQKGFGRAPLRPRTGDGPHRPGVETLSTRRTGGDHGGLVPASAMFDDHRRPVIGLPSVAPLAQGGEDAPEVPPLVGQPVVVANRDAPDRPP